MRHARKMSGKTARTKGVFLGINEGAHGAHQMLKGGDNVELGQRRHAAAVHRRTTVRGALEAQVRAARLHARRGCSSASESE
jgi:hypothetical protein